MSEPQIPGQDDILTAPARDAEPDTCQAFDDWSHLHIAHLVTFGATSAACVTCGEVATYADGVA